MSKERDYFCLVFLKEGSQLKIDLNRGVSSLLKATETQFQPHICLNRKEGVEIIKKIAENPEKAQTEFWINNCLIHDGVDGLWLNLRFVAFLEQICFPVNATLSPRQTSYIIKNLPSDSQKIVLEKIKTWYLEYFLENIRKGLDTITEQFKVGNFLIESDDENRIFDIHGGRHIDVPYTESEIAGEELFWPFFCGITLFDYGEDGYKTIDNLLTNLDIKRKSAADATLNFLRSLR